MMHIPVPSPDTWSVELSIEGSPEGTLARLGGPDQDILAITFSDGAVTARYTEVWDGAKARFGRGDPLVYTLQAPRCFEKLRFEKRRASIRLYADGLLCDEDWILGTPAADGGWSLAVPDGVKALFEASPAFAPDPVWTLDGPAQYFSPGGHNENIGDCMPFARGGAYHLYCLYDRRHHRSKQGLGAHQWAHLATEDLIHWTAYPLAVGIDEKWEGSICTGSLIEHEGAVWAFYAVRMSDGSPARLTYARAEDGVHFVKSGVWQSLTAPYEPASARDPKVWRGADGLFHMMVTTSYLTPQGARGCLAHLTSDNLTNWTQHEPILLVENEDQPECSDIFELDGKYYLICSVQLGARCYVSDQPFGPWTLLSDEPLDNAGCAVPKTAPFGGGRLVSSWVGRGGWGGFTVTHRLVKRADGTLGTVFIDELTPPGVENIAWDGKTPIDLPGDFRLEARVRLPEDGAAALNIACGDETIVLTLDRAAGRATLSVSGGRAEARIVTQSLITGDNCPITLILSGDAVDIQLPDRRTLTSWRSVRGRGRLTMV